MEQRRRLSVATDRTDWRRACWNGSGTRLQGAWRSMNWLVCGDGWMEGEERVMGEWNRDRE